MEKFREYFPDTLSGWLTLVSIICTTILLAMAYERLLAYMRTRVYVWLGYTPTAQSSAHQNPQNSHSSSQRSGKKGKPMNSHSNILTIILGILSIYQIYEFADSHPILIVLILICILLIIFHKKVWKIVKTWDTSTVRWIIGIAITIGGIFWIRSAWIHRDKSPDNEPAPAYVPAERMEEDIVNGTMHFEAGKPYRFYYRLGVAIYWLPQSPTVCKQTLAPYGKPNNSWGSIITNVNENAILSDFFGTPQGGVGWYTTTFDRDVEILVTK